MQTVLASVALAAAILGILYSNISALPRLPATRDGRLRPVFLWAGLLIAALFGSTLPAAKPFSPGLSLGWGFLIGGAIGLYAAFEAGRFRDAAAGVTRAVGLLSAAALGPAVVLLVFRGYPSEALIGCALGSALVAFVWRMCVSPQKAALSDPLPDEIVADAGVEAFGLAVVAIAVGARLAVAHYARSAHGDIGGAYWALPALVASVGSLGLIAFGSKPPGEGERIRALLGPAGAAAVAALAALLLSWKLLGPLSPGLAVLSGAVGMGIVAWLAVEADAAPRPSAEVCGIALVGLALVAIAFKLLNGYGEALALAAGLPFVVTLATARGPSRGSIAGPLMSGGFTVVLLLVLYRLFAELNPPGKPLDLREHYDYLGIALGALSGLGLLAAGARAWERAARDGSAALPRLIGASALLGVAAAIAPLAIAVVWGADGVGGFLIGLVAAELIWMGAVAWSTGDDRACALAAAPHVSLVIGALVAAQFTHVVLPLAGAGRPVKLIIACAAAAIALAWLATASATRGERPAGGGESDG